MNPAINKSVRTNTLHGSFSAAAAAVLLSLFGGCGGDDSQYVVVTLSSPATSELHVQPQLDGSPYGKKEVFTGVDSQFVLKLPRGTGGRLGVVIEGFQGDSCLAAEGKAEVLLSGESRTSLDVPFNRFTLQDCRIDAPILNKVWGGGSNDVWAAGNNGVLFHYDGRSWTQPPESSSFGTGYVGGIWGTSQRDVYFVGGSGKILHFDGKWERASGGTVAFNSVGGKQGDIWAVGEKGAIYRHTSAGWVANGPDGKPWMPTEVGAQSLYDVGTTPDGAVWAVGANGTALRFDTTLSRWVKEDLGTTNHLAAIASTSGSAWIAGTRATLFRWSAGKWVRQALNTAYGGLLRTVAIGDARTLWLGGIDGIVLRCDPTRTPAECLQLTVPNKPIVNSIWIGGSGEAWIAGGRDGMENDSSGVGMLYKFQP